MKPYLDIDEAFGIIDDNVGFQKKIQHYIDNNLIDIQTKYGWTLLHYAVCFEDIEKTIYLLDTGAGVNGVDNGGYSPLLIASKDRYCNEIVDILIKNGADINIQGSDSKSILYFAIEQNNIDLLNKLIKNNININERYKDNKTPLFVAVNFGYVNIVKILIANGAILDLQDNLGWTPLYLAIEYDNIAIANLLIKNGANLHIETRMGNNPMDIAKTKGYIFN
ncbi:ankyrin repeat domain-containing protein [Sulfurimonas sp.]|uniref:ankyrin repeat domain-containing protein n=1 Tax=Sulfurimonas sp. TaxID=2022749 RepID=UPI0035674021